METCCIKECDSDKNINQIISYFQFPLHDELLLEKWLAQINLPNWKPRTHHRICSKHFCAEDFADPPYGKSLYLLPTAIPKIFPKLLAKLDEVASTDRKDSLAMSAGTSNVLETLSANFIGKVKSDMFVLQSTPMVRIPTYIVGENPDQHSVQNTTQLCTQFSAQISAKHSDKNTATIIIPSVESLNSSETTMGRSPKDSETFTVQLSIAQPQLREILPKPHNFLVPELVEDSSIQQSCQMLSALESDVLPTDTAVKIEQNSATITNSSCYPGNKRPVLRISVNKQRNSNTLKKSTNTSNENGINISSDEGMIDDSSAPSASRKEIKIENPFTKRTVTFKLDPGSGEIVVTTRMEDDSSSGEEDPESTRMERKVDDTWGRPSAARLRQLFTKGQRECNALRKRLKVLHQCHREEEQEIEKLEEHLIRIGDRAKNKGCGDISGLRGTKRKEALVQFSKDYDHRIIIRDVTNTKEDSEITRDMSTTSDGSFGAKCNESSTRLSGNNGDSELLADKQDRSSIIFKSSNEAMIDDMKKCNKVERTVNETSGDLNPVSRRIDRNSKEGAFDPNTSIARDIPYIYNEC